MIRPPRRSPLFPYTTLFRSGVGGRRLLDLTADGRGVVPARIVPDALGYADAESAEEGRACSVKGRYRERRCRRSEEHTSELQSQSNLVCRLLLEKKN